MTTPRTEIKTEPTAKPVIPTGQLWDGGYLSHGQPAPDIVVPENSLGNGLPDVVPQVAHELLTPLTAILGILELLVDGTVSLDPEETTELVGLARDDAKQMTFLIADLLVSYRLANERLSPQAGPVGLQEAVVSALANFPRILRRIFVSPSLQLVASADPNLLQQVITNLVQNVDRYAPSGEVEVTFGATGTDVWIKISDDGPGIPIGERAGVFGGGRTGVGLGLGLGLSRRLARAMGGDLECIEPLRSGATFKLTLPASSEPVPSVTANNAPALLDADRMLSPRARLLVDMTVALTERSLDRALAGMQTLCAALLKAETGVVLVLERGSFKRAGSFGSTGDATLSAEDRHLKWVVDNGRPNWVERLDEGSQLTALFGTGSALLMPIFEETTLIGIFALEWTQASRPSGPALEVASALARLAAFAIERASLAADVIYERQLRSSVMEFLPLAISVYVGDPPRLVDRNRRERMMLGIENDDESPVDLIASQKKFNIHYIDGTPLDLDNAPVTWAIRHGRSSGPVMLRVRRANNSEVTVRMYCAPFFDDHGNVAGAVVSSEEMDSSA